MATIVLAGWREGLQKVALTLLQHNMLHLPLKEAKENTDRLLESEINALRPGQPILLHVADAVAAEFISQATSLGALVGFAITEFQHQPTSDSATATQQAA